jgi:hypothetical protein
VIDEGKHHMFPLDQFLAIKWWHACVTYRNIEHMLLLMYKLIYGQKVSHGEVESEMKPRMTCRQNNNLRQN